MKPQWRPSDAPRKAKPVFSAIVAREPIDSMESAALGAHPWCQHYPMTEWLTQQEIARLRFVRYRFPNGDDR